MFNRRRPGRPPQETPILALAVISKAELDTFTPAQHDHVEDAFQSVWAALNSSESVRAYRREWANYVAFLIEHRNNGVLEARTGDIQAYLESLRRGNLASSSRARALAVIRGIYGALARFGALPGANPAREAKNPKGNTDRRTPVLTETELQQFIQAVPSEHADFIDRRDYLIAFTAAFTGLRRANIASLAITNFLRKENSPDWLVPVRVKGDKRKLACIIAPLAEALFAWCREHKISEGAIFRKSVTGTTAISVGTVRNALKRQSLRAGIKNTDKISPHTFRRTFASLAEQRGAAVSDIQRDLMHSRRATTEGYLKYIKDPAGSANAFADLLPEKFRK